MIRKIIHIDQNLCNGCGLCVDACHEDAIGLIDGKATLLRDDYCDGLGDCLPTCPTNAITFVEREALEYNEAEVKQNQAKKGFKQQAGGCPGSAQKVFHREEIKTAEPFAHEDTKVGSELNQWPVQIQLISPNAACFENANLLVAADCAAFAYGNFHSEFMKNKVTVIGCPKLDPVDYSEKLTSIIKGNSIQSVTVARMEVPCCAGIENAVKTALQNSGKMIPWQVVVISTDGKILQKL